MYRYKHIGVAVQLDGDDGSILEYAAMISHMAGSNAVDFLYVADHLDIPEDLRDKYPDLLDPADVCEKDRLAEVVEAGFQGHEGTQITSGVIEGKPLKELLGFVHEKNLDLILVRRKQGCPASALLAERLARKAPCSVLIVPDGSPPQIDHVLVPVDFSGHSRDAVDVAAAFASSAHLPQITCLHVYHVPLGYGKTGISYEDFAESMEHNSEREYHSFIEGCNLQGVEASPQFELEKHPGEAIQLAAKKDGTDLVVIGARGRSASAAVLLGSLTEQLIHSSEIPVLAVKDKGAGMSLVEALLEI